MIVVFGATGNIGPHLVRTLVSQGVRVRAVVRELTRARALLPAEVELVEGALEQPESVKAALERATQVFCGVGGPRGTPELVEVECRLIDLAAAAGVQQYVKISGIDSHPDARSKIQRIHGEIEVHLRRSGLGYTILRPSFFLQNLLGMSAAIRQGALPLPTG
ncbi:MAG TPA: NAD(P)H-binding protein, partial [Polyangiaceae bacterium]